MPKNQRKPSLQGCRIALIMAPDEPISPNRDLQARAADLIYYPVAQTLPPDNIAGLDALLTRCSQGDVEWLLLTTANAVEAVADRMAHLNLSTGDFAKVRLALYGTLTTLTAASHFPQWQSALPITTTHQQVVDAMRLLNDDRVALPLVQHNRSNWPILLEATGAEPLVVPAYRLILGRGGDDLPGLLWGGQVDSIILPTEDSVRHFAIRLKSDGGSLDMLKDVVIACLDPQTAAAAKAFDLDAQVVSQSGNFAALADDLAHSLRAETILS